MATMTEAPPAMIAVLPPEVNVLFVESQYIQPY